MSYNKFTLVNITIIHIVISYILQCSNYNIVNTDSFIKLNYTYRLLRRYQLYFTLFCFEF